MKVIHITRKPISGKSVADNATTRGTGGLNIEAGRIHFASEKDKWTPASAGSLIYKGYMEGSGQAYQGDKHKPTSLAAKPHEKGRWPANVILEHLPSCQCVGEKTVKVVGCTGHMVVYPKSGGIVGFAHGSIHPSFQEGGKETVADWVCAPGCPIADLGDQSGLSTSPGHVGRGTSSVKTSWDLDRKKIQQVTCPSDSGTAARFFKQIGGHEG